MALAFTVTIGRLIARNEKLNTAKINAMVKGIVVSSSGLVGTTDLEDGAVTAAKTTADAYWYAPATSAGGIYTAVFAPVVASYTDGMWLKFKTDAQSKAGAQFNAGGGAKPLVKNGGTPVAAGDLPAGSEIIVSYNATLVAGGCWEVQSLVGGVPLQANFQTASARAGGERGFVPRPLAGQQNYFLCAGTGWTDLTATVTALVNKLATTAQTEAQWLNAAR